MNGILSAMARGRGSRVLSTLLAGVFAFHQPLSTATITVDDDCTLADAIVASNTDTATGGCAAGSGADDIELTGDVVLAEALPTVTQAVTFEGGEFSVARDDEAGDFRILELDVPGTVVLRNLTISNGSADLGGGIHNGAATLNLERSRIVGNYANLDGGGVYSDFGYSSLNMVDSTLADNAAARNGGGMYTGFGASTYILGSTISGNSAGDNGGGVYNVMYNYITVVNSTISGNSAGSAGGGLYNQFYAGDMSLVSTTISGNSAVQGGGVYSYPAYGPISDQGHITDLFLTNMVIANNTGGNCYGNFQHDLGGNFDDDGTCLGASPIAAGIDFDVNLANNGGPTLTHALLPSSVAIDAAGPCGLPTDQRGFTREAPCDSGAVEFGAAPVGGSISGLAGARALCRNVTTGGSVDFRLGSGVDTWDCEGEGLAVSPGDLIFQVVQGVSLGGAGGTTIGLAASQASCRNASTGQTVTIDLSAGPSWDCVAAGLVVSAGDRIRQLSRGEVP